MIKITIFGDSISNGQHVEIHKTWPVLLSQKLDEIAHVENMSVNGCTTRMALERMPHDIQGDPPDYLLIQFGQNDANRWQTDNGEPRVSSGAFYANLIEIARRARAFDARPIFLTNPPAGGIKSVFLPEANRIYNGIIREAAEATSAQLIDIEHVFLNTQGLMLDDGIHPNKDGHRVYANTVHDAIIGRLD